jgi:pilus assembly protein CpaE
MNFRKSAPDGAIRACTISEHISKFDLLIEDMENIMGEAWGDLGISAAKTFMNQSDGLYLEFVAITVDENIANKSEQLIDLVQTAKARDIKSIIVAKKINPVLLHRLLKAGADGFVPYPLPQNELSEAVEQALAEPTVQSAAASPMLSRNGMVYAVQGMSGGVGASTVAVNLAWEFGHPDKKRTPIRTLLIDLDLQFGAVSSYLDLAPKSSVLQLLSDTEAMDDHSFSQAITKVTDTLSVITTPVEIVPMDLINGADIDRLFKMARRHFDIIVVDMPKNVTSWTDAVLRECDEFFGVLDLEMRCTKNIIRFINLLDQEQQPFGKIRYVLNRAPKFTDLSGKGRIKRLSDALGMEFEFMLPDGGKQVVQCGDQGEALAKAAGKNPLRKELQKMSTQLFDQLPKELKAA